MSALDFALAWTGLYVGTPLLVIALGWTSIELIANHFTGAKKMSATVIILPTVYRSRWDDCPSDCEPQDHQAERVIKLRKRVRPPRSKPVLAFDRSQVITDDDFHGGSAA